jgi:hypothetical protein
MVTIDNIEYQPLFVKDGKEIYILVRNYPFPKVYGRGADEKSRIANAKSNFKLQVEKAKDVEVTWG